MSQQSTSDSAGERIKQGDVLLGRYEIREQLGSGGMAAVYRAHDELLNREVAIKVMAPWLDDDESHGRRFSEEARAAAGLNHANIVTIYDTLEDNGRRYIVMELVDGQPLSELIPLDREKAVDIACQLAGALEYAHSKGIIHCDIKPQNVLIEANGRPRLLDFGIARAVTQTWAMATTVLGTAAYMAPEVVEGRRPDERSDVYSLATLLYEMLSGRLPFEGDSAAAQTAQRLVSPPRPLSEVVEVPTEIGAAVMAALERDPDKRPQSADAFRDSLSRETAPAARDALTAPVRVVTPPVPAAEPFETELPAPTPDPVVVDEEAVEPAVGDGSRRNRRWILVPLTGLLIVGCFVLAFLAGDALFADDDDDPDYNEYFAQVQSTFDTFSAEHEQEAQQFGGQEGDDPESNKQLYVEFLRAYVETRTDFVATLQSIDPPEELEDEHEVYLQSAAALVFALDDFADQVEAVEPEEVRTLDISPYEQAEENQIRACNGLQSAASERGLEVNLQCSAVEGAVLAPSLEVDPPPAAADQAPAPVAAGQQDEEDDGGGARGEGRGNEKGNQDKGKDGD